MTHILLPETQVQTEEGILLPSLSLLNSLNLPTLLIIRRMRLLHPHLPDPLRIPRVHIQIRSAMPIQRLCIEEISIKWVNPGQHIECSRDSHGGVEVSGSCGDSASHGGDGGAA
jgi:hypothetical protein